MSSTIKDVASNVDLSLHCTCMAKMLHSTVNAALAGVAKVEATPGGGVGLGVTVAALDTEGAGVEMLPRTPTLTAAPNVLSFP